MQRSSLRANRGAAIITLTLLLFLTLTFLAFFVFDMNRIQMAQRQLTALCDSAALAGSSMLVAQNTSFEDSSLDQLGIAQEAAMLYAKNSFAMGYVLGSQLYDPSVSNQSGSIPINSVSSQSALTNVSPGQINVWIQLCSPINNYQVVSAGNSTGRAIYVQAEYGYVPSLNLFGIASVKIPATSTSGLQKLLVVMVFDCSGSMDDDTVVTFVERSWIMDGSNNGQGRYNYQIVGNPGQLWQSSGLNYGTTPEGTALNVLPPQNLNWTGYIYNGTYYAQNNSNNCFNQNSAPLALDIAMRSYIPWPSSNTAPVSGSGFQGPWCDNDFGTPPGNCPVKYGNQQSVWNQNRLQQNSWDKTYAHAPGPQFSPGYYYNGTIPPNQPATATTNDGNVYFYDPYSMPQPYTGSAYGAYTDMVANITPVGAPQTQPLYGPSTFAGFSYTFPSSSQTYTLGVAEVAGVTNSTMAFPYESDSELQGHTFNFSSLAYVVEAARGNLDLFAGYVYGTPNYNNALLNYGNANGMAQPQASDSAYGYQKAYQRLAMYCSQPYATAVDGAYRFFQTLLQTSDTIFGFVGFSVAPTSFSGNPNGSTQSTYNGYGWGLPAWGGNPSSLFLACPANPTGLSYSSFVYQPPLGTSINPNFWVQTPMTGYQGGDTGVGPAGNPPGVPYDPNTLPDGPEGTAYSDYSWVHIGGGNTPMGAPATNANNFWAFTDIGFQIPRYSLQLTIPGNAWSAASQSTSSTSFDGACEPDTWSIYNVATGGAGVNGLFHTRPLYDTDGLEALETALSSLNSNANQIAGSKQAIVFSTDGIPTDDTTPYSQYKTNVVTPAQQNGVAIYSVGIALNSTIQQNQSTFLQTLANYGANGSQYYQATNEAGLSSAFTSIARQLAQCQR